MAAADRVTAYLDRRAQMPGLDPEDITGVETHMLTVTDLRALVDLAALAGPPCTGYVNRETFAFVVAIDNARDMCAETVATVKSTLHRDPDTIDVVLGRTVIARWREIVLHDGDDTPAGLGSTITDWAHEIGSWERINPTEVGAHVRSYVS